MSLTVPQKVRIIDNPVLAALHCVNRLEKYMETTSTQTSPFTPSSKRRKGFPSETRVKRGVRVVHCDKELLEKLGRNDLCPCGSARKFKNCCLRRWQIRRRTQRSLLSGTSKGRRGRRSPPRLEYYPGVGPDPVMSVIARV